jgi:DNA-directed RNA polymerase sigma subunit (sigma70/sigma32)
MMATLPAASSSQGLRSASATERDEAIRDAFSHEDRREFGYTVEDIAEAAGLTRERIYQIVKETR